MNKGTKVLISALIMASLFAISGCNDKNSNTTKTDGNTVNSSKVDGDKQSDTVDVDKTEDENKTTENKDTTKDKANDTTNNNGGTDTNKGTNNITESPTLMDSVAQYVKTTYGDKSNIGKDRIINIDMQPGSTGKKTLMVEINADSNESSKKVLTSMNKIAKDIIIKTQEGTKKDNLAQDIVVMFYLPIGQNGANELIYQITIEGIDVLKKDWSTIEPADLKNHASVVSNEEYFSLNP